MSHQTAGARRRELSEIIVLGVVLFFVLIGIFHARGATVLQSDVLDYAAQSRRWWRVDSHLPGYAILIWALRGLTLGAIEDVPLMQAISLAAWCGSVYVVMQIAAIVNPSAARWGAALYGFFPFVGVTYTAWPISDPVVHLALAFGVLCLYRRDWPRFTLALSAMLLVQKALWPFALLMSLVAWRRRFPAWRILAAGAPLVAFWLFVAASGAGLLWIISIDMSKNLPSYSGLPVLDGVIGTLARGGARGIIKGLLLSGLLAGTCAMTWIEARRRDLEMLALLVPVLMLLLALNQWEAWASMRFAKILVIPLMGLVASSPGVGSVGHVRGAFWVLVGVLAATQVAMAVRIVDYFSAGVAG